MTRRRAVVAVCAATLSVALLGAVGAVMVLQVLDETAQATPQRPAAPSAVAKAPRVVTPRPAPGLRPSRPVRLEIPRLKVRTTLVNLGKNADGTLQVPPPARAQQAGWYRYGAAPGARGAAVIAGHVDSKTGPAIFFRLAELRPGDLVRVWRKDRRIVVFRIDSVEHVAKTRFPTRRVYGKVPYPGIRLITCGGGFDRTAREYTENVIAYGHLVSSSRRSR